MSCSWDVGSSASEVAVEQSTLPPLKKPRSEGVHRGHEDAGSTSMAWWTQPLLEAISDERASRGRQEKKIRIATGCSGTEAPVVAAQATTARV